MGTWGDYEDNGDMGDNWVCRLQTNGKWEEQEMREVYGRVGSPRQ